MRIDSGPFTDVMMAGVKIDSLQAWMRAGMLPALLALAACGGGTSPGTGPGAGAAKPQPVVVQSVARSAWVDRIQALGTAKANESATSTID